MLPGYVETTTSGARSSTARLIGLAASHWVSLAANQRVGGTSVISL